MIDTHVHLLEPDRFSYAWVGEVPALTGTFDLSDYEKLARPCGVEAGVFMEGDCGEPTEEAQYVCSMAATSSCLVRAVVAAARPESLGFEALLDDIAHPRLVGIRRVLHTQPDALSRSSLFRRHVGLLGARGLSFDVCVTERQLPIALELAECCPETPLILDHCGCPDIPSHGDPSCWDFWKKSIRQLAALPHVNLKFSGITAYASPAQRNAAALHPYFETVLDAFGPNRILWGGDWPVVNLGNGLPAWVDITQELLSPLTATERAGILTTNARKTYRIP